MSPTDNISQQCTSPATTAKHSRLSAVHHTDPLRRHTRSRQTMNLSIPESLPSPGHTSGPSRLQQQDKRQRQRKWHPRVFTGCLNCRKRHVKCDEQTPSCANCKRLDKVCTFSLTFVSASTDRSSQSKTYAASTLTTRESLNVAGDLFGDETEWTEMGEILSNPLTSTQMVAPATGAGIQLHSDPVLMASVGSSQDALYYQHFLRDVSTLLIVFDTPSNSNPYRMLPSVMGNGNSQLLRRTMEALGAMHLSRLPETQNPLLHRRAAVDRYAGIVASLRSMSSENTASLDMLAISLLLCMFEKMSSTDSSWKVHLLGACHAFQSIFSPSPSPAAGHNHGSPSRSNDVAPIRRFLVSLMSYLDIAASCATGEGPLIPGDYWETLGGGWQYNLGVPSFAAVRGASYRALAQLRSTWSRIMSIQKDISRFAKLQRLGLEHQQRILIHGDLVCRLRSWHDSTPDIFLQLEGIDGIPNDASEEQAEVLTATACVQSYALASTVFLDRVMERRVGRAAFDADIKTVVDRILTLCLNFSSGVGQLAVLWPLLTAGIATVDAGQQDLCRAKLTSMKSFGFEHVSRALETLEYSWRHMRLYGGVEYETFEAMLSSNLVP